MNRLELGQVAFTACWIGIWLTHAIATAYYSIVAGVYFNLHNLYIGVFLSTYEIGIDEEYYLIVAAVHVVCATAHAFSAVNILVKALRSRRQCAPSAPTRTLITNSVKFRIRSCLQVSCLTTIRSLANQVFGNEGLLGVNGKWYGTILVAREFLELSLQTVQAYKMSKLLSATTPTDFYTGLLIGNCWITAWIRIQLGAHAVREHFFSLLLDCVLDLVTVVGLSVVIAAPYIVNTEWILGDFWDYVMVNDERLKQATMELEFVSVSSWSDLSSRVVFAIGLLYSLGDMKSILHTKPTRECRRSSTMGHSIAVSEPSKVSQMPASSASVAPLPFSLPKSSPDQATGSQSSRKTSMLVSFVFVIWGVVLLVFHLYARSIPLYSRCSLQVQPWGASVPLCYFVNLNCQQLGIHGIAVEVDFMLRQYERSVIETLHIFDCSSLELSPLLQDFTNLVNLKIYNTSIAKWDADAAISGIYHPKISCIELTRVTFANATLPQGLMPSDVPWSLKTVLICVSNLRHLPKNLAMSWPSGLELAVAQSELNSFDEVLIELKPYTLSLFGNPLQTVPPALFEIDGLYQLDLSETFLQELPEHVSSLSSSLAYVYLSNTFVTTFWAWIDPLVTRSVNSATWAILAFETPYCQTFNDILNGNASNFAISNASNTKYSVLMDANEFLSEIQQVVLCGS